MDKEKTGLGLGTQIGKSSSRALEAQGMKSILLERIDKEKIGFG